MKENGMETMAFFLEWVREFCEAKFPCYFRRKNPNL